MHKDAVMILEKLLTWSAIQIVVFGLVVLVEVGQVVEPFLTSSTLLMMALIVSTKISNFGTAPSADHVPLGVTEMLLFGGFVFKVPITWCAIVVAS